MTLNTPNLDLPYIAPGQAQKHVTHNDAIRRLDALIQISASSITNAPPASPEDGERVIVGDMPSGEFSDQAGALAAWQDGAWFFFTPQTGWQVYVQDAARHYLFEGGAWSAQETGANPVPFVGVQAMAQAPDRLTVQSASSLFTHDGAGHQLKINKSAAADTASLVFQTGFSGRAEIGLVGDENLQIKVSPDGTNFQTALMVDAATGSVSTPGGLYPDLLTPTVNEAGGPDEFYGLPNALSTAQARSVFVLEQDRMYFFPIYLDRPMTLTGGFLCQPAAGTTPGSIIRAGLYHLGAASGNVWDMGDLVADMGPVLADTADNKIITLGSPVNVSPGWYAFALGTDGADVEVRYVSTATPGLFQFEPHGAGTGADIRLSGAGVYLFENDIASEITGGLSSTWPTNPVADAKSPNFNQCLPFIPRWMRWPG